MPDAPTFAELATNDLDRRAFGFMTSVPSIGRSLLAPPGVPPERVETLRAAFMKMAADPAFVGDAAAQLLELGPLDGASLQALADETFSHAPDAVARAKATSGL